MAGLKLSNITKQYPGGVTAVSDFNLEVLDKEFVIFVGPSGCGKSTLLRIIAGLEDVTSGEVFIDGKRVNDAAPKDRDIAMVFQNYALYPHMTVYENIAFGLTIRKVPRPEIDQKVRAAAEKLGIGHLLDRKPKALSGGERQRVAMGRAMVREPKVFLMDEPLSNLDAKLRVQMRAEIAKLHKQLQTTFIYVTHDQTEAMTLGTRIVVLKDGVEQQIDTPENLYNRPRNVFVAGFIGSPQMNFIHAEVSMAEGGVYLQFGTNKIKASDDQSAVLNEKGYIGQTVIMGIRPGDIFAAEGNLGDYEGVFTATVELAEFLGTETVLHLVSGDDRLVARFGRDMAHSAGETLQFRLDLNRIHFFDRETELSVENC